MSHRQSSRPTLALRAFAAVLATVLLMACSPKPPGCADEQTVNVARALILDTWKSATSKASQASPDAARYNEGLKVEIRNITVDGYNADARKYACNGAFVVTTLNGMEYTVQRDFTSQATVNGQEKFVVQIGNVDSLYESLSNDMIKFAQKFETQRYEAEEKKKVEALQGHSFDCSKADSPVERSICGDPKLAELDVAMVSAYNVVLSKAVDKPGVRTAQATWRDMVRNECTSAQCLVEVHQQRIDKLSRGDWTWR